TAKSGGLTRSTASSMMQRRAIAQQKMLSVPHLIIIFLVALIVFGPEKLPDLARRLGKATAEFRRATESLRAGFEDHMRELERDARVAEARKEPTENTIGAPPTKEEAAGEPTANEVSAKQEVHPPEVNAEKNRDGDAKPV
ncbi:MAG TPA: twin-arginine translocase TatA/TatE family subunit, partial [Candidatus Acidoferrales bacterium]|nr:twin-arginine translocase TatA/TatE family subunit [Candidatus Acidoferrales bacterium]